MDVQRRSAKLGRRLWLIVGVLVLCVGGGRAHQRLTAEPEYTSTVTFFVGTPDSAAADEFVDRRMASHQGLMTSDRMAAAILASSGFDMSVEQLQSEITTETDANSVVLTATVSDSSPGRSLAIAQAMERDFPALVSQVDPIGPSNIVLRVVSAPSLGAN